MQAVDNIYGYDIYLLSKEECSKYKLAFPSYVLIDSVCPNIEPTYASSAFSALEDCVLWARKNRLE